MLERPQKLGKFALLSLLALTALIPVLASTPSVYAKGALFWEDAVSPATITAGNSMYATAVLSYEGPSWTYQYFGSPCSPDCLSIYSSTDPVPTGSITWTIYSGGGCGNVVATLGPVSVYGYGSYNSPSWVPPGAGTYVWDGEYVGNIRSTILDWAGQPTGDGCGGYHTTLTVNKATPTLSTAVSPSTITLGASARDAAYLSGGYNPAGTISFYVFNNTSCYPVLAGSTVSVSGDGVEVLSDAFTPTSPGTYYWEAGYSGDANNNGVPTPLCGGTGQTLTVDSCLGGVCSAAATPTLSTAVSPSTITLGDSAVDRATLSGGDNPTGIIIFNIFNETDCSPSSFVGGGGSANVNGNGNYSSGGSFYPTSVGTYYWIAEYGGDANNSGVNTPCGAPGETLIVTFPTTSTKSYTTATAYLTTTSSTNTTSALQTVVVTSTTFTFTAPAVNTGTVTTTSTTTGPIAGTTTTTFTSTSMSHYTTSLTASTVSVTQTGTSTTNNGQFSTTTIGTGTTLSSKTSDGTVTVTETDTYDVLWLQFVYEFEQFEGFIRQTLGFQVTATPVGQQVNQVIITITSPSSTCVADAPNNSNACEQSSAGTVSGFAAVTVGSISPSPPAQAGNFPDGLFSFQVSGLTSGQTVTVTLTLSSPLPSGDFSYWKFHGGTWTQMPSSKATLDSTRTVIKLTLTDGASPDDADGLANGVIVDPGGPTITPPATTQPATHPVAVGGEMLPVSLVQVLAPWIAVMLALTVVAVETLLVQRRQTRRNRRV